MANTVPNTDTRTHTTARRRISTETKSALKTTELIAYVVAVIAVLIAAAVVDGDHGFSATDAWRMVTFLTIGYMVSRGLAKSGSRDFYDEDTSGSNHR